MKVKKNSSIDAERSNFLMSHFEIDFTYVFLQRTRGDKSTFYVFNLRQSIIILISHKKIAFLFEKAEQNATKRRKAGRGMFFVYRQE